MVLNNEHHMNLNASKRQNNKAFANENGKFSWGGFGILALALVALANYLGYIGAL